MLPIRGQNNVQGASDMGAIPFVYTDYRTVKDPEIRDEYARAWGVAPESLSLNEGLMVTEIVKEESGVRGMYIMGENPIISDPDIAHAEHWFRELEFLAVQDLFLTETARYADVVLPGSSFAEKTGTFVNTERRIQLGHKAVEPPGEARGDLQILIELSNRLGLRTAHRTAEDVMVEIVAVTPSWRGVTYDLNHYVFRRTVCGSQPESVGQLDQDLEVAPCLARRLHRLVAELDAPLGVHERPGLLGEARAREHDVGVAGGLGEEEILHREALQLSEPVFGVRDVRIGDDGVLAHDVHPADPALLLYNLRHHHPLFQREGLGGDAPGARVLGADPGVLDRAVVGVDERDRAHVGGALDVVLAADRQHRRAPAADHAATEHQVEERGDEISAVRVLRQPHRPQGARVRSPGVDLRGPLDLLRRYSRDLPRDLRGHRLHRLPQLAELARARRDELLRLQALAQAVAQHRVRQGRRRAARPRA